MSSLEATVDALKEYEKEHWHKLAQDLQLLIDLPRQMAGDIAKLEGKLEAKIDGRLSAIETRLGAIEAQRQQLTGARMLGVWLIQTIMAAAAAIVSVIAMGHGK